MATALLVTTVPLMLMEFRHINSVQLVLTILCPSRVYLALSSVMQAPFALQAALLGFCVQQAHTKIPLEAKNQVIANLAMWDKSALKAALLHS